MGKALTKAEVEARYGGSYVEFIPPVEVLGAVAYSGDGNASRAITGMGIQPNAMMVKRRTGGTGFLRMTDDQNAKQHWLNNAPDETSEIASYDEDGFTVNTASATINAAGSTFIAQGFTSDVVETVNYAGNSTAGRTVAHTLGSIPGMVWIVKRTGGVGPVKHLDIPATHYLQVSTQAASAAEVGMWNDTEPSGSVITLGDNTNVNITGKDYTAYLFKEIAGKSAAFSYTGNGSSSGPVIELGFYPKWVLIKKSSSTGAWLLYDIARDPDGLFNDAWDIGSVAAPSAILLGQATETGLDITGTSLGVNTSGHDYVGFAIG